MKDDTVSLIGKILDDCSYAERDAIHIAVLPVIVGINVWPGNMVSINQDGKVYSTSDRKDAIGIIDPFLRRAVLKGERCFVFLFPGTITSLKHHWVHNDIPEGIEHKPVVDKVYGVLNKEHEEWLREFAERWSFDYTDLIEKASSDVLGNGWDSYVVSSTDLHGPAELGEDHDLFWYHLEKMLGRSFSKKHRDSLGWSCSC